MTYMGKVIFLIMILTALSSQSGQCSWFDIYNERDYIDGCLGRGDHIPKEEAEYLLSLLKEEKSAFKTILSEPIEQEDLDELVDIVLEKIISAYDNKEQFEIKKKNLKEFKTELLQYSQSNISLVAMALIVLGRL